MKAVSARRAVATMTCLALVASGAGCGSKSSVSSGSGKGRPVVTVGYRDTPEQRLLGELYAQGLRVKGFSVKVKPDLPDAKAIDSALRSGQIDVYPEYIGVISQAIAGRSASGRFKTPESAYASAKKFEEGRGLTLLDPSKYSKNTVLVGLASSVKKRGVLAIAGLRKKLRNDFSLGGPADLRSRFDGLVGLKSVYGVVPRFTPIAPMQLFKALASGKVDLVAVSSTDPQLLDRSKYHVLGDKRKVFGFQNVAPVVAKKTLVREGPAFAAALAAVTARLSPRGIRRLNELVQTKHRQPAEVARTFIASTEKKAKSKRAKNKKAGSKPKPAGK